MNNRRYIRYGNGSTWKTDISYERADQLRGISVDLGHDFADDFPEMSISLEEKAREDTIEDALLSGEDILELMGRNVTVRVFERLGVAARRKREFGSSLKKELFEGWDWPAAIPHVRSF